MTRTGAITAASPERMQSAVGCAEVAGGTAAECAAVVCCCPCGLLDLLVLALVRLPAGLCHRAVARRRRKKRVAAAARAGRKKGDGLLSPRIGFAADDEDLLSRFSRSAASPSAASWAWPVPWSPSPEVAEMEKEMWARFYSTGFWRSPSQRDER